MNKTYFIFNSLNNKNFNNIIKVYYIYINIKTKNILLRLYKIIYLTQDIYTNMWLYR